MRANNLFFCVDAPNEVFFPLYVQLGVPMLEFPRVPERLIMNTPGIVLTHKVQRVQDIMKDNVNRIFHIRHFSTFINVLQSISLVCLLCE